MSSTSSISAPRSRGKQIYLLVSGLLVAAVAVYLSVGSGAGTGGHFTGAMVCLCVAAFVLMLTVWILFRSATMLAIGPKAEEARVATGRRRKELEREKQALLKAIKELEFDHEMGKISDSDFREIGGLYRQRAVRVLRQLDEASGDYRAQIEREVAARLGVQGLASRVEGRGVEEDGRRSTVDGQRSQTVPISCSQCGTVNDADAAFCKKCGIKVSA